MTFTAFRSEGGLLPADILDQIATGSRAGQRPIDFGLDKNRRLTDEIAAAWADARDLWKIYQRALSRLRESDSATTATRDQWVVPLLHLLGYDELTYTSAAAEVDKRAYAISHWAGGGYQGAPIHIIGARLDLDKKDRGRLSPHALLQEYLNRTEDHLWGLLTNGLRLRVLRNSAKLTRPTYLEIDLEQIMAGEKFAEFSLLYRLLHRTRLPGRGIGPTECLLEQYYQEVQQVGGRVREKLRDGVEAALKELGTGFLGHPANAPLRERLQSRGLSDAELYRQLLRLIYRILFLMVAEERRLVGPESSEKWDLYAHYYSVTRLRTLAERFVIGAERHMDLWRQLRATFAMFRSEAEGDALEVSPLDGDLFGPAMLPDLEGAELSNQHLISAVRHLSLYEEGRVRRRVNYGALDVEELGSVYESLLEYKPRWNSDGGQWDFDLVSGSERRATGSYYTHPDLVHQLIVHALDPVIEERKNRGKTPDQQVQELLSITVCDPACGSGHFLLAAARRISGEVARIRAGEDQVQPEQYRKALRDVIQHCIYGVDLNPLAVDLCKVALWLEGLNRGRPLNFLDHRIRRGNSLVGSTPELLAKGVPDAAYDAVTGDDKKVAAIFKKRNREERQRLEAGQLVFDYERMRIAAGSFATMFANLDDLGEESTEQVHRKKERFFAARKEGTDWHWEWTACNLWTAAFFAAKESVRAPVPTTETVMYFLAGVIGYRDSTVTAVNRLAEERGFFHWHLEFPEVYERGGFDCVLGNPPFLGGLKISTHLGPALLKWLHETFTGASGTADLCAYFFRRSFAVLRQEGNLGLIATNTIAQGDTRAAGLQALQGAGSTITFGVPSIKWPGDANLQVALLALHKGPWVGERLLDGRRVEQITPLLDDGTGGTGEPIRLKENGKAFIGSFVLGMGFVLEPSEARRLLDRNPLNQDVLFPYLVGEDLNTRPDQSPSRWVINFQEWPLERAETYPECMEIIRAKVKPERDRVLRQRNRERWWIYAETRPGLYGTISGMKRVLVASRVTKHLCFTFTPVGPILSEQVVVIATDRDEHFAILQSTIHEAWVRRYSGTLETRLRYSPSDCFETFPFPAQSPEGASRLETIGSAYHEHRRRIMLDRQLGLTKTYNLFHAPVNHDADISELRRLRVEMDGAVLSAYGWRDIDPHHDFYGEGPDTRFTISPEAKKEVLQRLLDLNRRRAAEESQYSEHQTKHTLPEPTVERVSSEPGIVEIQEMPSIMPALGPVDEAAVCVLALLHASRGKIPRTDLARAFALRSRPDVLIKLAPTNVERHAQEWAGRVGQRSTVPGLLAHVLKELVSRNGIALTTEDSSRVMVTTTEHTPPEEKVDPWFRYEARLALKVLANLPRQKVPDVDATISGADRQFLTTEAI